MKNRAVTLLLCLMLAALSILRAFPASAEGITPATAADFSDRCGTARRAGSALYRADGR